MPEALPDKSSQVDLKWLEGHPPASLPYIIGFSFFIPMILGANIALEFWLAGEGHWAIQVRQGLLNAGTMSTWGIPLTILSTELITKMLARHYIAKREKEANAHYTKMQQGLEVAQQDLEVAQQGLEVAQQDLEVAQQGLEVAQQGLEVAQQDLEVAQQDLETWHSEQMAWYDQQLERWQKRRAEAEAEGKEFDEVAPTPPPPMNLNGDSKP